MVNVYMSLPFVRIHKVAWPTRIWAENVYVRRENLFSYVNIFRLFRQMSEAKLCPAGMHTRAEVIPRLSLLRHSRPIAVCTFQRPILHRPLCLV
jgi:hypothetical protein